MHDQLKMIITSFGFLLAAFLFSADAAAAVTETKDDETMMVTTNVENDKDGADTSTNELPAVMNIPYYDLSNVNIVGITTQEGDVSRSTLHNGFALVPGGRLVSENNEYEFVYTENGNLVGGYRILRLPPFYSARTQSSSPQLAVMQDDGNFVLYELKNGKISPYWHTNTVGDGRKPPFGLVMQKDRNVVVYNAGEPLWHTNTAVRSRKTVVL